jgi:hypothetical protein
MIKSALKVAKDPLGSNQMNLTGIMHMEENLLDSVCDVRLCESQILESSHKAAVCCRISYCRAGINRCFGTCINWSEARVAATHAMSIKNVQNMLPLGENNCVLVLLNDHTEKMVKRS